MMTDLHRLANVLVWVCIGLLILAAGLNNLPGGIASAVAEAIVVGVSLWRKW